MVGSLLIVIINETFIRYLTLLCSEIQNFPNRQDNGQEAFDVYQTSNDSKTRGTASRVRLCVDELFSSPGMKLPR